jgi:hypothetical protein
MYQMPLQGQPWKILCRMPHQVLHAGLHVTPRHEKQKAGMQNTADACTLIMPSAVQAPGTIQLGYPAIKSHWPLYIPDVE